ncbi:MAG: RidA family protein [Chlorobium sp.]|jgi:enamine deaminase RidA (YjgF/YER057c/UK114 family)|uniref:RidA family protein n=1 Tax=Chlorobium sp. TaxID=1095 RepID=UPI0025B7F087|nr:RidA family protein [Chlorobium sp.]MCF8216227.1 RidA family protein [Chlorobium sp.]MCF8271129.1 RidA family protein [Chlorobium sp.]MCF8287503.1 RidA family protein [Chlorobium sp.]MCF8291042.1 RidA family protein [Chlorobium sp.]MCF8385137.1 RidA family protein [Chlorobium sp.]
MSHIEDCIIKAGYHLPGAPAPAGLYLPASRTGNLIFTSGQLPLKDGKLIEPGGKGKVNEINQDDSARAAGTALLNALAAVKSVAGSLDTINRIVRLTVYVASESYFTNQHLVANGASSLLFDIFGEKGRHVRSAVGVAELPLDASVEIELIVECNDLHVDP